MRQNKLLFLTILLGLGLLVESSILFAQRKETPQPKGVSSSVESTQQPFSSPVAQPEANTAETIVSRVIDGDTVVLDNGTKVRYIGIDTPETGVCFADFATEANKKLVLNKKVGIEKDVEPTDRYGRTLAYLYIGDVMVNEELVKTGYAKVYTFPPNVKYVDKFIKAQESARSNSLGLWATDACSKTTPSGTSQVQGTAIGCDIKGNINSKGEKIYHTPGQHFYEKTQVDESRGERWFCSEEEATKAGWRKSKT